MNGIHVFLIVFTVTILPLIVIMHYVTKWKSTKGLSDEEQQLLEDLWRSSERMESRLNALETILEDGDRTWRKKL